MGWSWELFEEGMYDYHCKFESFFRHWPQQFCNKLCQLRIFLIFSEGESVLFSQDVVEILGASATLGMGNKIFVTWAKWFLIEKKFI